MSQLVIKRSKTQVESLSDITFMFFLITEFGFQHSIIGKIGLISFFASVGLLICEKRKIRFDRYFFFYALFILYNVYNIYDGIPINSNTSLAMLQTLILNFFILLMVYNYFMLRNNINKVFKDYVLAVNIFTLLAFVFSINTIFSKRFGLALGINSNRISIIVSIATVLIIFAFLNTKNKYYLFNIGWYIFIVLLTESRTGLLLIFIACIIMIYFLYPNKRIRNLLIFISLLFITYLLITKIPILYNLIGSRVEALFQYVMGNEYNEGSLKSRSDYIKLGWEYFLQRPLRGYGLDCFRLLKGAYGTYSHNNFIEILISSGIIGFIIYYIPLALLTIKILQNKKKYSKNTFVLISLLLGLIIIDYSSISYYERSVLLLYVLTFANPKLDIINKLLKNSIR